MDRQYLHGGLGPLRAASSRFWAIPQDRITELGNAQRLAAARRIPAGNRLAPA